MAKQEKDFSWREVGHGYYERDVDEAEQFYATLAKLFEGSGRMLFAMTAHVSIVQRLSDTEINSDNRIRLDDALRKAWIALRHQHPGIASVVEYDAEKEQLKKCYQKLAEERGEDVLESAWFRKTCQTVPGMTGVEFCNADPPAPKMPTLFILQPNPTDSGEPRQLRRDLVIRSPHELMDGIGSLYLLQALLSHVSEILKNDSSYQLPKFGDETQRLSPPLRVALGVPSVPDPKMVSIFDRIVGEEPKLREDVEIAAMPFKRGALMPGKHQRTQLKLSTQRTKELLSRCKALGCSVTHVYHTAIAIAVGELQERKPTPRTMRYLNYGLLNLREHCQKPYNTPAHAASVYHRTSGKSLAVDLTVPALTSEEKGDDELQQEFSDVLKIVKAFYLDIREDQDLLQLAPLLWQDAIPHFDWALNGSKQPYPDVPPPNPTPSASISSLGMVDKIIDPDQNGMFDAFDPFVTGEELGTGFGLFLATYRGQLVLSCAFNDAWHDVAEATEFVNRCDSIVRRGLKL